MSSYRPKSLLQMEMKILSKVLSNRLCRHTQKIIQPDQLGFVPGCHIYSKLRRLFNIMYHNHKEERMVTALDAEKAFDHREWKFMLSALALAIHWINIIYTQHQATIFTNGETSQPVFLHKGARQGCSCSSHLFNLCIKVLASQIRADYKPIQILRTNHHLSLFADDITLYLLRPKMSLPPLLQLIETFGSLSGYTTNWEKSELFPISDKIDLDFLRTMPFTIVNNQIKSLGIIGTRKYGDLLKSNCESKIQHLQYAVILNSGIHYQSL